MADPVVHITNGIPDSGTGNITTLGMVLAVLPTALGAGGGLKIDGSGTALPISGSVSISGTPTISGTVTANAGTNLNTSLLALEAGGNLAQIVTQLGSVSASPPANTVNDRLKTINTTLGSPFQAGGSIGNTSFAATQSGTWTVQPGNTQNTTPWLVRINDGTTSADVKAASTAAVAADKAVVVAISPNNYDFGNGTGGSHTQRIIVDSSQFSTLGQSTKSASAPVTIASDQGYAGNVGGITVTQAASSTIARPADTTQYTSGDLIANSVTAGSVNNLQFTTLARISGGSGVIIGAQIQKSTNSVTNAAFRLHLFNTAPTYTSAGDNSALTTVVVASGKGYLGYIDITAMVGFSDVAWGSGAPDNSRGGIPYVATAQIIYGLLEARGGYTPGNAEIFTITLDALQD